MIAGTSSSAGKSAIAAALCRLLAKRGYDVAPFKAQNMSLNSYVTRDGKEIAIAQAFQAFAAGVEPDERMNPVLLKPKGNFTSQLVLMGEAVGDVTIEEYWRMLDKVKRIVVEAYESLASEFDFVVIEGAGGIAEINLYERDIANIFVARLAKPRIAIVGDIDRGGVFASLYGSYMLLPEDVRRLVCGFIINRLRGRENILKPGIEELERLCGVRVLGVLPYLDAALPSEDSLNVEEWNGSGEIGIVRLPKMSNYTDFEPLRSVCEFVELSDDPRDYELLIVPGSKDTIADLLELKRHHFDEKLRSAAGKIPIIGICGGYQMLGRELIDHGAEHGRLRVKGLGLLNAVTEFRSYRKRTVQVVKRVTGSGVILDYIRGEEVWGYEIHKGVTRAANPIFEDDGCVSDDGMTWGTYLHGLFWNGNVQRAVEKLLGVKLKGESWLSSFDELAEALERLDLSPLAL